MESLLQTLTQQFISFTNIYMSKYVNSGDRAIDAIFQLVGTAIVSAFTAAFLNTYKNGTLAIRINKMLSICSRTRSVLPTDFNPALASGKPANDKHFTFNKVIKGNEMMTAYWSWYYTCHSDKRLVIQNMEDSIQTPGVTNDGKRINLYNANDMKDFLRNTAISMASSKTFIVPIWFDHSCEEWVYMQKGPILHASESIYLSSDSAKALNACFDHIYSYGISDKFLNSKLNEDSSKSKISNIYEFNTKDNTTGWVSYISPNKTFDKLFFDQKTEVMEMVQKFKTKTLFPPHLPLDNKLGILLYGPPGTGKTCFLSAMANYLNRNIFLLDMKKIKTRKQLDHCLSRSNTAKSLSWRKLIVWRAS